MTDHNDDRDPMVVAIPRMVLIRALTKARLLYIAHCPDDPGPDDECWAEFEALASYVGTTAELIAEESAMVEAELDRHGS